VTYNPQMLMQHGHWLRARKFWGPDCISEISETRHLKCGTQVDHVR